MGWKNPTKQEAQDAYDRAKSSYRNTAEDYVQNNRQLEDCYSQYRDCSAKVDAARSEKLNFEKRIEQIGEVIRILDDGGAADEAVANANSALEKAEENMSKRLKCTGIQSPAIKETFRCKTVKENQYSNAALESLKKEKARLEQAVQDVNSKLNAMEQNAQELTNKMNSLTATQADLSRKMKNLSFNMTHYKNYI